LENPSPTETLNIPETAKTDSQTTLVMCEELRKLNKIDSIIPQPLLNVYVDIFKTILLIFIVKIFLLYFRERPTNAVVVWTKKPLMEFVRSFPNYQEPKSTVVITEITDEEENGSNDKDMLVEENK